MHSTQSAGAWLFVLTCLVPALSVARAAEPEIVGSDRFKRQVSEALALLKERDADAHAVVTEHVGRIQEAERSGMWAYKTPPTFDMSGTTAFYSITWCAAAIAHDAYHSKLYHDYRKKHSGDVPLDAWTGKRAEQRCMKHQIAVMERIGAPKKELEHAKKMADGQFVKDNKDWEEYRKRKW